MCSLMSPLLSTCEQYSLYLSRFFQRKRTSRWYMDISMDYRKGLAYPVWRLAKVWRLQGRQSRRRDYKPIETPWTRANACCSLMPLSFSLSGKAFVLFYKGNKWLSQTYPRWTIKVNWLGMVITSAKKKIPSEQQLKMLCVWFVFD